MGEELIQAILNMKEKEAAEIAETRLKGGGDPLQILEDCRKAMAIVGERFEKKEYYLPELIVAGELMKQIANIVKPHLKGTGPATESPGKVVLGTVAGDVHDIGKDIVGSLLDAHKFDVYDLGVDVPAETFVKKVQEVSPQVVGMSGFMTLAFDQMKATVEALRSAGVRDRLKIMIGGAQMDDALTQYIGADAYGPDAATAVELAQNWTGVK